MKEMLEKLPMCTYKKNVFIFDITTDVLDGEYIIVRNKIDDFSLYQEEMFKTIEDKLSEASSKNKEKKNLIRYILTIADAISIKSGKLKLPVRYSNDIYSESFYVKKCNGYIRLIGSECEEIREQDFVEMVLLR